MKFNGLTGKIKKRNAFAIFVFILCLALTSCFFSGEKGSGEDENKTVLKWVMPGPGKQIDSDKVWKEFNTALKNYKGFEGVEVNFEIIPSADYRQRFMLIQAGEDDFDIAGTYMLDFQSEVKNGIFYDITELIDEYAPDIKKEIPAWAMKMTMVDSKQYAITNYQQMASPMWGYNMKKEFAEKYIDTKKAAEVFLKNDILTDETLDIFEAYMDKLKQNGELNMGIRPGSTWAMKGYLDITDDYVYRVENERVIVENRLELETVKLLAERFSQWYKKGYIREDVLSADVNRGVYDIMHTQYHKYAEEMLNKNNKKDIVLFRSSKNFYLPSYSTSGGNAVFSTSENKEKAVEFLNLMYTKKGSSLYRLLVYGIEDVHYKKVSENKIEPIGYTGTQATQKAPYGLWKWIVGNTANAFETVTDPDGWNDYVFNDWNKNAVPSAIAGIYIDKTPIEVELSQCSAVSGEYLNLLTGGAASDWKKVYNEAMKNLELAGNDKVKAYLQKIIDEYIN